MAGTSHEDKATIQYLEHLITGFSRTASIEGKWQFLIVDDLQSEVIRKL
jgi:hypothetical protein